MSEHQDWNVTVLNKTEPNKKNDHKKVVLSEQHSHMVKLEHSIGDEGFHHETVSYTLKMQIQQARVANKLNQKQLAERLGVTPRVVNEYESGKAIPNNAIIQKMSKILGVKLKK